MLKRDFSNECCTGSYREPFASDPGSCWSWSRQSSPYVGVGLREFFFFRRAAKVGCEENLLELVDLVGSLEDNDVRFKDVEPRMNLFKETSSGIKNLFICLSISLPSLKQPYENNQFLDNYS